MSLLISGVGPPLLMEMVSSVIVAMTVSFACFISFSVSLSSRPTSKFAVPAGVVWLPVIAELTWNLVVPGAYSIPCADTALATAETSTSATDRRVKSANMKDWLKEADAAPEN